MSRLIQGTTGLIYQGREISFTRNGGIRNTEVYQGDVADVEAALNTLIAAGTDCQKHIVEGKKARLLVDYSDSDGTVGGGGGSPDAYVLTTWSLHPSLEKRPIVQHPYIKAIIETLSDTGSHPTDREVFANALAWARKGVDPFGLSDTEPGLPDYTRYTGAQAGLNWVIYEYLKGDETYDHIWATLKKSRVCPRNTAIASDWTNIMFVFTTTELTTAETTIPSAIIGTLPTGHWLKLPGEAIQQQDGRVIISTEYHYRETDGWNHQVLDGGEWTRGIHPLADGGLMTP